MPTLSSYIFPPPTITAYTQLIGNGAATSFTITHNLNKSTLYFQITEESTGAVVYPDITMNNSNVATISFSIVPLTNSYRVNVLG